jgi:hypothetical protein
VRFRRDELSGFNFKAPTARVCTQVRNGALPVRPEGTTGPRPLKTDSVQKGGGGGGGGGCGGGGGKEVAWGRGTLSVCRNECMSVYAIYYLYGYCKQENVQERGDDHVKYS